MQLSGLTSTYSDARLKPSSAILFDAPDMESDVMIDTLTEDAVNTACLGFDHQSLQSEGSHGTKNDHFATMIVNIEDAQSPDWLFSVASGSWKRICINLISNALKFTPSGYINVTLRKTWLDREHGRERIALIDLLVSSLLFCSGCGVTDHFSQVEDTGIGMSDEFRVKSLFRPFQQEDSLTPGIGLVSLTSCTRMSIIS